MSSLISNAKLTVQLESYIPVSSELNIISAFVTQPAFNWLRDLIKYNRPTISMVGRFTPQDFIVGASDINTVRQCIKNGFQVSALSNLHAKIYQMDSDIIFTGSANFTGKGLALVEEGNLESCCRVEPCEGSKAFINKILSSSISLTLSMVEKMEAFLEDFVESGSAEVPNIWPENIMPKITDLFVTDFPLTMPGISDNAYTISPSLEFAIIEKNKADRIVAKHLFLQSKAYQWLLKQVKENEEERDLGFGKVSSLLHDALCDDPAPYRRDIKSLQANLYAYVTLYATDQLEIYVPGRRSQILRLVK